MNLIVSNTCNIIALFVGLLVLILYRGMHIKATIVAYTFSMQHFENTTTVAYEHLRVKEWLLLCISTRPSYM